MDTSANKNINSLGEEIISYANQQQYNIELCVGGAGVGSFKDRVFCNSQITQPWWQPAFIYTNFPRV